jgi:hypothetical protein
MLKRIESSEDAGVRRQRDDGVRVREVEADALGREPIEGPASPPARRSTRAHRRRSVSMVMRRRSVAGIGAQEPADGALSPRRDESC